MRLQHRRARRSPATLAVWLVTAVAVLTCLLFVHIRYTPQLPEVSGGLKVSLQSEVDRLRIELQNATSSLDAYVGAHQYDADRFVNERQKLVEQVTNLTILARNLTHAVQNQQSNRSAEKYWLVIGVPTVPRRNDTDYLTPTLSSALEELPLDPTDLLFRRVKIVVMNHRPGNHSVFSLVKARVEAGMQGDSFAEKAKLYVDFIDNQGNCTDPTPDAEEPDDFNNPKNLPGRQVRRQTCDLMSLLEHCQALSHYYLFMEDDFRVCPNMLRILQYVVHKMNAVSFYKDWLGLRLSYGMNGILVKNKDLPLLHQYFGQNTARLPPDLLWIDFYKGRRKELKANRGRELAVYRFNLLEHLGERSSFSVRASRPDWPKCFHPMADVWSLARTEIFHEGACNHTDLFPCLPSSTAQVPQSWLQYPISWPNTSTDHSVTNAHSLSINMSSKETPQPIDSVNLRTDKLAKSQVIN